VSIKVLGVFTPLPLGEGGNTNRVCDARGVALTPLAGAGGVSVDGKGTRIAGGLNDFRREDRGALDEVDAEESPERAEDESDGEVIELAKENELRDVEGKGMTSI
jgi:hypothetical protein